MDKRGSIKFYRSFYEAAMQLEGETQREYLVAIMQYAFDGVEPELSGVAAAMWMLTRPNIDAYLKKADAGASGGKAEANRKQTASELQANAKQTATEEEEEERRGRIEAEKEEERGISENIFDDEEELLPMRAREGAVDESSDRETLAVIGRSYRAHFGTEPTPAQAQSIARSAGRDADAELLDTAIELAARAGAKNPPAYIAQLYREFDFEQIRDMEDYCDWAYLNDAKHLRISYPGDLSKIDEKMRLAREARRRKRDGGRLMLVTSGAVTAP